MWSSDGVPETLREAYELGWTIVARCKGGRIDAPTATHECKTVAELDLPTLLWTRGRDFPLARLGTRLRCVVCGSRDVAVFFKTPPVSDRATAEKRKRA